MFRSSSDCGIGRCRKANYAISSPHLRVMPACALPEKTKGGGYVHAGISARLSGHITLEAQPDGSIAACFDGYAVGLGKFSADAAGRAQGIAHRPAARFVCVRRRPRRQGNRSAGPATGPARSVGIPPRARGGRQGPGRHRTADAGLLAANARSSAMPNRSCCRGSRICGGAATRWCWNRRAPARCSEFAIRRSRPPSRCCRRRNRSKSSGGRTAFRGSNFWRCWWIARSFSRSTLPAAMACARPKATTTSFCGIFTIFCSTPTARKGRQANPLGGLYPYAGLMPPPPAVRPRWPGKKIDLRKLVDDAFGDHLAGRKAPA